MSRVLLTGAAGFSGSHALRRILAGTDWDVVCPVSFRHHGLADRLRLVLAEYPEAAERVTVIRHDLTTPISGVTDEAFGPIDYVLNYAAESHVDRSITHPGPFIQNNVALATNLLDWCRTRREIQGIVQVSTDEVYGPAPEGVDHAEWVDLHLPSNPYAASKAAQEDIAFAYWRTYDLPILSVNVMNIIGHMQSAEKFVPMTISRVMRGEPMTIHASADGQPGSRMYLHAWNKADGILHALKYATTVMDEPAWDEGLRYSFGRSRPFKFHIAGLEEVDNLRMAQMIADAAGQPLKYELVDFHSSRPGHDLRYALDSSKIASTGWTAPIPFEESLEATVKWTIEHPEWFRA